MNTQLALRIATIATLGTLLVAAPAVSGTLLFDNGEINPAGGTVTYDGVIGSPIIGLGIGIDGIRPDADVPFGTELDCIACVLNFNTGPVTSEIVDIGGGGVIREVELEYGGGGFFEIRGGIIFPDDDDNPDDIPAGTLLLSGSFTTVPGIDNEMSLGNLTGTFSGGGLDWKHPSLVEFYFGFTPDPLDGLIFLHTETVIALNGATLNADGSFEADVGSADVTNFLLPEPGTITLMLLGVAGLVARRRRV